MPVADLVGASVGPLLDDGPGVGVVGSGLGVDGTGVGAEGVVGEGVVGIGGSRSPVAL